MKAWERRIRSEMKLFNGRGPRFSTQTRLPLVGHCFWLRHPLSSVYAQSCVPLLGFRWWLPWKWHWDWGSWEWFMRQTPYLGIFFSCYATTPPALQLQQERTQVVCSNREAQKRPARKHCNNGPWTSRHTHTHEDRQKWNRTKHTSINTQHRWTSHT